jgi:hypothetical protein
VADDEHQRIPWVHGSDDDLISAIAHALRYDGRRPTRQADILIAEAAAARVLETLKRSFVITPKPPAPLATADQHPRMGNDR